MLIELHRHKYQKMDLGMPLFSEKHKYKNSVCMNGGEKGGFSGFWSLRNLKKVSYYSSKYEH